MPVAHGNLDSKRLSEGRQLGESDLSSILSEATWTPLGVGLRGKGLVRWNSDYSLTDFFGHPTAVGSSSGVTTAIFDAFNVRRGVRASDKDETKLIS